MLAPWFLAGGAVASLVVALLHLIAWSIPRAVALPTARFVPEQDARAATWLPRPRDFLLLALRILLVALLALAFAQPVISPGAGERRRVVLLDVSRASDVDSLRAIAARAVQERSGHVILFDTTVRASYSSAKHTADKLQTTAAHASLTLGLLAATRWAAQFPERDAGGIELVLISPVESAAVDAASERVRALWRGPFTLMRIAHSTAPPSGHGSAIAMTGLAADDPIAVAARTLPNASRTGDVRIVRIATAADSVWTAGGPRVLVVWPDSVPHGWSRPAPSTPAGLLTRRGQVLVAPLEPTGTAPPREQALTWWADGSTAVTQQTLGRGCVRTAGVAIPSEGDVALSAAVRSILSAVVEPCGGVVDAESPRDSALRWLSSGASDPRSRAVSRDAGHSVTPLVPWILGAALLVAIAELLARRAVG